MLLFKLWLTSCFWKCWLWNVFKVLCWFWALKRCVLSWDLNHFLACSTLNYNFFHRYLHHRSKNQEQLDDQIKNIKTIKACLELRNKAVWCFQMTSAIAHTHFMTHKFHMNIKSINFVLNFNQNLILINWKQSEILLYILALKANDFWNIKEMKVESSSFMTQTMKKMMNMIAMYVMILSRCKKYLKDQIWSQYLCLFKLISSHVMKLSFEISALFLDLSCAFMYDILHFVATLIKTEKLIVMT